MLNNIARIQRALRQAHLDAILLTNENDRRFATGFPSSDGTVIVTVHQAFFITDSRYIEAARAALAGIAQVLLCSHEAPMRTLVQGILREANVQLLGGEEQTTSYAEFTAYEQLLGLKLQPAQSILRTLRASKQPEELAMMYQAQQITDETFAQICTVIRPGMTEREIAAELIYRMLRLGAEGTSFDPIVLTGPDTSMPHGVPGDRRVAEGDFVTMDFGCRKNGYCSDMTRTVAVGMPSDEMRTVYQTVLDAQLAGIAAAKAGVTGERVDAAARKVITDAGYGDCFGHPRAPHRRARRARKAAGAHRHLRRARHLSARQIRRAYRGCAASDGRWGGNSHTKPEKSDHSVNIRLSNHTKSCKLYKIFDSNYS